MILVESPGLQTTVQDLGRPGYGPQGISASGAADPLSLRIGNALVGNREGTAALEMTLVGGRYRLQTPVVIAITGAAMAAKVEGAPVEHGRALDVAAGAVVEIGSSKDGVRSYLCVSGGIQVAPFLGSASTHLLTGIGGFEGRALRKGDSLPVGPRQKHAPPISISREMAARLAPRKCIRVTHGLQSDCFTDEHRALFVTTPYCVTQEANRMGLRLEGTAIPSTTAATMITEGVALGAVQVPSSGQPIILFVEQQTTGGYPKIANVIAADLPSVGQLRPGDETRFEWVSIETAVALLREQESLMRGILP